MDAVSRRLTVLRSLEVKLEGTCRLEEKPAMGNEGLLCITVRSALLPLSCRHHAPLSIS
jgi:hypothetical protein